MATSLSPTFRIIAANTKRRRLELGLTQGELAERAAVLLHTEHMSRVFITRLEQAAYGDVGYLRLAAIARALHCTVAELAGEVLPSGVTLQVPNETAGRIERLIHYPAAALDTAIDLLDRVGARWFLEQPQPVVQQRSGNQGPEAAADHENGEKSNPNGTHAPSEREG